MNYSTSNTNDIDGITDNTVTVHSSIVSSVTSTISSVNVTSNMIPNSMTTSNADSIT